MCNCNFTYLVSGPWKKICPFILHSEYHGRWLPGEASDIISLYKYIHYDLFQVTLVAQSVSLLGPVPWAYSKSWMSWYSGEWKSTAWKTELEKSKTQAILRKMADAPVTRMSQGQPCWLHYSGQLVNRVLAAMTFNDDVIKLKHFPRYWPFLRGIHRSPVNSPHKGQWREALVFSLICAWINDWVNNRKACDLRRHRAHYDVIVMWWTPVNHQYHMMAMDL